MITTTTRQQPNFDVGNTTLSAARFVMTAIAGILPATELDVYSERGISRVLQPDGSYKWFAIDPDTNERVEIDPDQAWFWTEEWQAGEREADEDLREGRYRIITDVNDLLSHL